MGGEGEERCAVVNNVLLLLHGKYPACPGEM